MFGWVFNILSYLGLYYKKTATIVFLGLDNAGKTTLLRRIKDNVVGVYQPTFHPNYDDLVVGNVKFRTYDLGGHKSSRPLWDSYLEEIDGIVFIVDASDSSRFDEAKNELNRLLNKDNLAETPILVLGNKIDLPRSVSEGRLRNSLNLPQKGDFEGEPLRADLFMCSVVKNIGYKEGFKWLSKGI